MPKDLTEALARFNDRLKYQYDVFISYSSGQTDTAHDLYQQLSKRMHVFYAPVTLKSLDHHPNQYVEVLTNALMQSTQTLVLLSKTYLQSSWCQLELSGYFNLCLEEPERRLWIVALEAEIDDEIAGQFVPFVHAKHEALTKLIDRHQNKAIQRGDKFANTHSPKLFLDLPLYELYEPPTTANRPPWGKNARSPHGMPGAPPYEVYQQLVREYMVQLLRQGNNPFERDDIELAIPMIGIDERYDFIKTDARKDAGHLLSLGISPYAGTAKTNVHGIFANVTQAHLDNAPITTELNCLEAFARICMGYLDEGIAKMERALKADPSAPQAGFYKTELARAKLIARDFAGALAVVETIDIAFEAQTLVRNAALARLDRLSATDKDNNRNSGVSLDSIRIWSLLEDRQQLDYWIESLELAGYGQ